MDGRIDEVKDEIESAVSDEPVGWAELVDRLGIEDDDVFENAVLELLTEDRVRHDAREGTYRIDDE